jgi:hypothetical protein
MRPNSPEVIFLMLGRLKESGHKPKRLDPELLMGLLVDLEDLEDAVLADYL